MNKNKKQSARVVEQQQLLLEIGVPKESKTYEELCKEAREAIQSTAEDWIPRFCVAIKRQHPLIAAKEIRRKVVNDWASVWKAGTMVKCWPDWMKNPLAVGAGQASAKAKSEKSENKFTYSNQDTKQQQQQQQQTPEQQQAIKDRQKQNSLEQNIIGQMREVQKILTGLNEDDVLKFRKDYRALMTATKDYRFQQTKKFTDLNLQMIYDDSRAVQILLNDFLEKLDDELGTRKRKESLTSE